MKAAAGLIRILVDREKNDKLFTKYKVLQTPTILFLDPEGKQVGELGNYQLEAMKQQFLEITTKYARGAKWMQGPDAALSAGKSDSKPVVLVFVENEKIMSVQFVKSFSDPAYGDVFEKVALAKIEFKKDSEECKKWKVAEAPTMLIIDPTGDEAKVLKTLKGGTPQTVRKELDEAIKKLKK